MSGNRISNEAAAALMLALEHNTSLIRLELGSNQLGDGICAPIAQMMLNNQVATPSQWPLHQLCWGIWLLCWGVWLLCWGLCIN